MVCHGELELVDGNFPKELCGVSHYQNMLNTSVYICSKQRACFLVLLLLCELQTNMCACVVCFRRICGRLHFQWELRYIVLRNLASTSELLFSLRIQIISCLWLLNCDGSGIS